MTEAYKTGTRVRVRPTHRGLRNVSPAANWIPDIGEVVMLLEPAPRGNTLDVIDIVREKGGIDTIYSFNIVRALPKQKNPPTLIYCFSIEGQGNFPVVLLSDYKCWPATIEDAIKMYRTRELRKVNLCGINLPNRHACPWVCTINDVKLL